MPQTAPVSEPYPASDAVADGAERLPVDADAAGRIPHALLLLLIAAAVFASYTSTFSSTYGYADDYGLMRGSVSGAAWVQEVYDRFGRSVLGIVTRWAMSTAGNVENLRFIRLSTAIQLLGLGALVYYHLIRLRMPQPLAGLTAVFVVTSPPFQIQVAWATYVCTIAAAALTYLSYRLAGTTVSWRSWRFYAAQLGAVGVTWLTLSIYQPSAMFYCFWLLAEVLLVPRAVWRDLRRLVQLGVPFALGGLVYFALWRLRGQSGGRTVLESEPLDKLAWFFRRLLPETFNFHYLVDHTRPEVVETPTAVWVGLGILAGSAVVILVLGAGRLGDRLGKLTLAVALLPASYAVNLVVASYYSTYRTRMALMALAGLVACYAAWLLIRETGRLCRSMPACVMAAAAAGLVILASYTVHHYIVWPQSIEYAMIKSEVHAFDPARHNQINLIHNRFITKFTPDSYYMEFGLPTSNLPSNWNFARAMVWFAMRDVHPQLSPAVRQVPIERYEFNKPPPPDPAALVIDMRLLQSYR